MLTEIGSYEAKTKLAELLRGVSTGRQYVITLRGRAIAELVPPRAARGQDRRQAAESMRRFMREAGSETGRGAQGQAPWAGAEAEEARQVVGEGRP
jgi:prevent-host-death family protein